jgi:ribosomal protein S21
MDNKKSSYWKFAVAFVVIVILALGAFVAARFYEKLQAERAIERAEEALRKEIADYNARLAQDTYGGKTPQETLQMYIDAVEKGDYVLASKYFIADNQEKELRSLQNSPKENTQNILRLLKTDLQSEGSFSEGKDRYGIEKPLFIDFKLYPNGIWKIVEI